MTLSRTQALGLALFGCQSDVLLYAVPDSGGESGGEGVIETTASTGEEDQCGEPAPPLGSDGGRELFVSPSGNDEFTSLEAAVAAALPGDTVIVRDGTYHATNGFAVLQPTRAGTPGAWITFRSENPWGARLDADMEGPNEATYGVAMTEGMDYIAIEGFEILNSRGVGVIANAPLTHFYFRGNRVHDTGRFENFDLSGAHCLSAGYDASHVTIEANVFHACGRLSPSSDPPVDVSTCTTPPDHVHWDGTPYPNYNACYQGHGMLVQGDHAVITNNLIYDVNSSIAINLWGNLDWKEGMRVVGNTFGDSVRPPPGMGQAIGGHILIGSLTRDMVIANNLAVGSDIKLVYNAVDAETCGDREEIVLQNNLTEAAELFEIGNCPQFTDEDNGLEADPRFVDRAASNYRLTASSPAVDGGANLGSVSVDPDGTLRPRGPGYDIGAYEREVEGCH